MGPYLSQPKRDKTSSHGEGKRVVYAFSEMQGWRNTMEDAHITRADLTEEVSVFGIFDGHGGKEVAYFVEKHFIEELQKNKNFQSKQFSAALTETFLKMDELLNTQQGQKEINQIKGGDDDVSYAGCTANVALIHTANPNTNNPKITLYVANSGDSRSVLCRQNGLEDGKPKYENFDMSVDHKPDNTEEKRRIEKAGGFVSDGRVNGNLNLSRALGDLEYKRDDKLKSHEQLIIAVPDVKEQVLTKNDRYLLMGCDGVFETLSHQELINFINEQLKGNEVQPTAEQLQKTLENLLDRLLAPDTSNGTGCDNMTSIIVYFRL